MIIVALVRKGLKMNSFTCPRWFSCSCRRKIVWLTWWIFQRITFWLRRARKCLTYFEIPRIQSFSVRLMDLKETNLNLLVCVSDAGWASHMSDYFDSINPTKISSAPKVQESQMSASPNVQNPKRPKHQCPSGAISSASTWERFASLDHSLSCWKRNSWKWKLDGKKATITW